MLRPLYSWDMNKKLFKKISVKGRDAKPELIRAHGMIALLAIALGVQLTITTAIDFDYNQVLSIIAAVLLAIVAMTSLGVMVVLSQAKK